MSRTPMKSVLLAGSFLVLAAIEPTLPGGITPDWSVDGPSPASYFGAAVSPAGDVNGDTYDDVIVGAPGDATVHVYLGGADGLPAPGSPDRHWEFAYYTGGFGSLASRLGDVNGDGYDDVLLLRSMSDSSDLLVYAGGPTGLSSVLKISYPYNWLSGPYWIVNSATGGDFNGDGVNDIILGLNANSGWGTGWLHVFYGVSNGMPVISTSEDGSPIPDWSVSGEAFGDSPGFAEVVQSAGDVDHDGSDDILACQYNYLRYTGSMIPGAAYLYHGSSSQQPDAVADWTHTGNPIGNAYYSGHATCVGDMNADGYRDIVVDVPVAPLTEAGMSAHSLGVYFGSASGFSASKTPDKTSPGTGAIAWPLGLDSFPGDYNGDGFADLLVGEYGEASYWTLLYTGGPGGLSATPLATLKPALLAMSGAGDVDRDGISDIIIGNRETSAAPTDPPSRGSAWFYRGRDMIAPLSVDQREADGITPIDPGAPLAGQVVRFTGAIPPGMSGSLALEVEIVPVASAFTGANLRKGTASTTGAARSVDASGLAPGEYHWRARLISSEGWPSPWVAFGANPETAADLVVPGPPDTGGGGGGGGGGGCSAASPASGAAVITTVIVALAFVGRRSRLTEAK